MDSGESFIFLFSQLTFKIKKKSCNSLVISIFKAQVSPSNLQSIQIIQIWQQYFKNLFHLQSWSVLQLKYLVYLCCWCYPWLASSYSSGLRECSWVVFPSVCSTGATSHSLPALPMISSGCTFFFFCCFLCLQHGNSSPVYVVSFGGKIPILVKFEGLQSAFLQLCHKVVFYFL